MLYFMLSGDNIITELIDFTHIGTESWEDERINVLILDCLSLGVFYASLGFTDVVYYPRNKNFRNVIFRLEDTKVSFVDGLRIHSYRTNEKNNNEKKYRISDDEDTSHLIAGERHPSLFKRKKLISPVLLIAYLLISFLVQPIPNSTEISPSVITLQAGASSLNCRTTNS